MDTNVVGIVQLGNQGFGICSGSLISPNVVLTARHCVSRPSSEAIVCDRVTDPSTGTTYEKTRFVQNHPAENLYVSTDQALSYDASRYVVGKRVVYLPGPDTDYTCGNDIALIVLSQPITNVEPLVPRIDSALQAGEAYDAVGYGATSDAGGGSGLRRRRNDLQTQAVGEITQFNFTQQEATEWSGNAGVCQGDSGGPALDKQGRVVGMLSRGGRNCSSPIYGRVDSRADFLKSNVQKAAAEAGIQPPPWAAPPTAVLGDACEKGGTCVSGICIGDGKSQYCSQSCTDDGSCGEGYICDAGLAVCVKGTPVEEMPPPPPPPTGAANGQACTSDSECASTYCNPVIHLCADKPLVELPPITGTPNGSSGCAVATTDSRLPASAALPFAALLLLGLSLRLRRRS